MNKEIGGIAPIPIVTLQTGVKCFGVHIHNITIGTKELTTNPVSIIKLVNQQNQRFLLPGGNKALASAHAVEPAGYSAPIPIPKKNL